jgi:hypothetical protein
MARDLGPVGSSSPQSRQVVERALCVDTRLDDEPGTVDGRAARGEVVEDWIGHGAGHDRTEPARGLVH